MAKFIYPTDTTRVTSGFRGSRSDHHGVDLAESGYHPIYAAASGKVSRSYFSSSYGECIMIVHTIDGVTWETVYAHMRSGSRTVKEGDYVTQGQTIGVMGSTGQAEGQHLHFELHKGSWNDKKSNAVNPLDYLEKGDGGNTTDPSGNKPLQPEGIGIAVSKY
ncbi:M23 family metallopeptidase, partial [Bacillus pseudomycoides]|nr:M23 family metallopeptidase [Bacillus pseudomycoides]